MTTPIINLLLPTIYGPLDTRYSLGQNYNSNTHRYKYKIQLDIAEHAAIKTREPSLNCTDNAPECSKLWAPIIPKILGRL